MAAVSIIVPFFNRHALLRHTVESVLAQTFGDFEMIIVDDGSTPSLQRSDLGAGAADPRIAIVRQDNRGSGAARNTGLAQASANHVLFLDSDDLLEPQALAVLSARVRDGDFDAVVGNWMDFSADGPGPLFRPPFPYADAMANAIEGGWATGSVLLRRKLDPVCSEDKAILPWDMADCYHRALRDDAAKVAHVDQLVIRMRQDSGGRLTVLHDHFEPMKAGRFWRDSKASLPLNDERRSAIDRQIFRYVLTLFHAGRRSEATALFAAIDVHRLSGYRWYKPLSPAWFARWCGVGLGLTLQRLVSRAKAAVAKGGT